MTTKRAIILLILISPLISWAEPIKHKDRVARSSIVDSTQSKQKSVKQKARPAKPVINISASLIPVTESDLENLSQAQLADLVAQSVAEGSIDQLSVQVSAESGKTATFEQVTEFFYPTEYEPARIHKANGDNGNYNLPAKEAAPGEHTIVVPASPTKFKNTELGYHFEVTPTFTSSGNIRLKGFLRDKIFMAFADSGKKAEVKRNIIGNQVKTTQIAQNKILKPVFDTQNATIDTKNLTGQYYLPYFHHQTKNGKIAPNNNPEKKATTASSQQPKRKSATPRSPAILVLEATKDPAKTKTDPSHLLDQPAQVYITSKFIETDEPLNFQALFNSNHGSPAILTDPQYQILIRSINQKRGVDLLSAPSVMARTSEPFKIEVIREFIFPGEYRAPELDLSKPAFGVGPSVPVKDKFEIRNTGVTLEGNIAILNRNQLRFQSVVAVREFDGFVNYGNPIIGLRLKSLQKNKPIVFSENRVEMPTFPIQKVDTSVILPDGYTIAYSLGYRETSEQVMEKFLGIKTKDEKVVKRRYLTVFVKAETMNPINEISQ